MKVILNIPDNSRGIGLFINTDSDNDNDKICTFMALKVIKKGEQTLREIDFEKDENGIMGTFSLYD